MGMGGHHSAVMGKDEWLTPPAIIEALGPFDLDPCSPIKRPIDTARRHYTIDDDGLAQSWDGRVWCNPPYGSRTATWLGRMSLHGDGVALIFARTETDCFHRWVWAEAHAVFFFRGRLHFHHLDGTRAPANAGAPSCLVAYGQRNTRALERSGLAGRLITLRDDYA